MLITCKVAFVLIVSMIQSETLQIGRDLQLL